MSKPIIVFDLDNTLINSSFQLNNEARKVLLLAKIRSEKLYLISYNEFAVSICRSLGIVTFFNKIYAGCKVITNDNYKYDDPELITDDYNNLIFCKSKALVFQEDFKEKINRNCILFDDLERNIKEFIEAGGKAYLVKNRNILEAWNTYLQEEKKNSNQNNLFNSNTITNIITPNNNTTTKNYNNNNDNDEKEEDDDNGEFQLHIHDWFVKKNKEKNFI